MKKNYLVGFLLLLTSTIGMLPTGVYANDEDVNTSSTPVYADTDLDGYPDHVDSCPSIQETWNKFQDDDGCPDSLESSYELILEDLDKDGVKNDLDVCPYLQEDYEGLVDGLSF